MGRPKKLDKVHHRGRNTMYGVTVDTTTNSNHLLPSPSTTVSLSVFPYSENVQEGHVILNQEEQHVHPSDMPFIPPVDGMHEMLMGQSPVSQSNHLIDQIYLPNGSMPNSPHSDDACAHDDSFSLGPNLVSHAASQYTCLDNSDIRGADLHYSTSPEISANDRTSDVILVTPSDLSIVSTSAEVEHVYIGQEHYMASAGIHKINGKSNFHSESIPNGICIPTLNRFTHEKEHDDSSMSFGGPDQDDRALTSMDNMTPMYRTIQCDALKSSNVTEEQYLDQNNNLSNPSSQWIREHGWSITTLSPANTCHGMSMDLSKPLTVLPPARTLINL